VQLKRMTVMLCYAVGVLGFGLALRGWGDAWLSLAGDAQGVGAGEAVGESLYWARFVRRREGTVVFY